MFMLQLQQLRREELRCGYTWLVPSGMIAFLINGMDLRKYGSQGQQRSAVLACILAELELMQGETGISRGSSDDVMSELDQKENPASIPSQ